MTLSARMSNRCSDGLRFIWTYLENGHIGHAYQALLQAKMSASFEVSLDTYVRLLSGISPRAEPDLTLCFMRDLEAVLDFNSPQEAVYFAKFSRWQVQEFLAEYKQTLDHRVASSGVDLESLPGCTQALRIKRGKKRSELDLTVQPGGTREVRTGDCILVMFTHTHTHLARTVWMPWCKTPGPQIEMDMKVFV